MIEKVSSKSGHTVFKWSGRLVCTSLDPIREARDWVKKHQRRLTDLSTFVVLGVGCGYHIAELRRRYPQAKILAIDICQEMVKLTQELQSLDTQGVESIVVNSPQALLQNTHLMAALGQAYAVVRFHPSTQWSVESYDHIESTLLGRNSEGFQWLLQSRDPLADVLRPTVALTTVGEKRPVTIKNLVEALTSSESSEGLIVRALRELVN